MLYYSRTHTLALLWHSGRYEKKTKKMCTIRTMAYTVLMLPHGLFGGAEHKELHLNL